MEMLSGHVMLMVRWAMIGPNCGPFGQNPSIWFWSCVFCSSLFFSGRPSYQNTKKTTMILSDSTFAPQTPFPSPSRGFSTTATIICSSSLSRRPVRYAVLGAGFAGVSVVWHLLNQCPKDVNMQIDLYDEVGIGGGASGVSGGLLHPYSPKGKLLWRGAECWKECLMLLGVAESAAATGGTEEEDPFDNFIVRRRIETIDKDAAQRLVPNICTPFNSAFYMPQAVNVHPLRYLQGLFSACQNLVDELSSSACGQKELSLHTETIKNLAYFEGKYDAVIICLGAKANLLPELCGRLPLRMCRGVIAHLRLPFDSREDYPDHSPSILSDAWLAVRGKRSLYMGSTWEWKSRNTSPNVSAGEASKALEELLPKASAFYPGIKNWIFAGARAGLRAMPPLTPLGSLPILDCVDEFVGENCTSKYWLFGGLGSRGLLYHAWLGKLLARAVLCCNADLIPSVLRDWKTIKQ